ncbi:DUF3304 domain-containing protein [Comamonas sp. GB3 AK4-5]|uniref:DUF3304 domain-containing protein n=1 Tax=Comamonas sp. GB3 AK4-5 TaxID=3231487 RepID=UPI00351DBE0E
MKKIKNLIYISIFLIFLPVLTSCKESSYPANIIGYNHTDKSIGDFFVNGYGGGFLDAHKGGGVFVCCISIPKKWSPDQKVTIKWTNDHGKSFQERTIPIPEYKESGQFDVHFLYNGEIKVFVTPMSLWHPDSPLKGPEAEMTPGVPLRKIKN